MSRAKVVSIKSDIIRKELREGGVLLKDAAHALGISAPYFCRALREERLSQSLLYRLADFLYKDPNELTEDRLDTSERFQAHKWIPCSERLPERKALHKTAFDEWYSSERVLVWIEHDNQKVDFEDAGNILLAYYDEDMGEPGIRYGWSEAITNEEINPVAWMPLPEPYKGGTP